MGRNTMIRIRDRKNVAKTVRTTNNLLLFAVMAVAAAIAWMRWPRPEEAGNTTATAPAQLKRYEGVIPPERQRMGMSQVYDIRDPAVLLDLTGRLIELGDDPLQTLPIEREWDGEPEKIVIRPPAAPAPKNLRRIVPKDGEVAEPRAPEKVPPEETDPASDVPPDIRAEVERINGMLDQADAIYSGWRQTTNDAERNAKLKGALELYTRATEALRPLKERYPDMEALSRASDRASLGRHACFKHRTQ